MIAEVEKIDKRKKQLLKELIDLDVQLAAMRIACDHTPCSPAINGVVLCTRCGQRLIPGCPTSPKGFHVHEPGERNCIYCGTQIVGK